MDPTAGESDLPETPRVCFPLRRFTELQFELDILNGLAQLLDMLDDRGQVRALDWLNGRHK